MIPDSGSRKYQDRASERGLSKVVQNSPTCSSKVKILPQVLPLQNSLTSSSTEEEEEEEEREGGGGGGRRRGGGRRG